MGMDIWGFSFGMVCFVGELDIFFPTSGLESSRCRTGSTCTVKTRLKIEIVNGEVSKSLQIQPEAEVVCHGKLQDGSVGLTRCSRRVLARAI